MPKIASKKDLPKLEDWKAPWEVKKDSEGKPVPIPEDEQEIDPAQLKRYLHGLLSDKVSLRSQLEETTAEAEALQQKLADAKTPEELTRLKEENARLIQERDAEKEKAKTTSASDLKALKLEIALDKGLTKRQAARLVGSTKEELEEDADALIAEFGGTAKGGKDEGEESGGVGRGPRKKLRSGGKDENEDEEDDKPLDYDALVKQALANR